MEDTESFENSIKKVHKVSYILASAPKNNVSGSITEKNKTKLIRKTSSDTVIVEQPLQITLTWLVQEKLQRKIFTITMRTPGHDDLLILGLLKSEGVFKQLSDIESIKLDSGDVSGAGWQNEWLVQFCTGVMPDLSSLDRYMMSYSSCGLCGTTSLKALELKTDINLSVTEHKNIVAVESLILLSSQMRRQQGLFEQTGGVHGAALFDQQLNLQHIYEDIGRHNAVDKVIGALLLSESKNRAICNDFHDTAKPIPLYLLLVSGRISFEIVQKTIMAGIHVLVGVGAPSDLAIQAAKQFDLTLIGFVRESGFNVYHGDWRLTHNRDE